MTQNKDKSAERLESLLTNFTQEQRSNILSLTISWIPHPDIREDSLWPVINITFKE